MELIVPGGFITDTGSSFSYVPAISRCGALAAAASPMPVPTCRCFSNLSTNIIYRVSTPPLACKWLRFLVLMFFILIIYTLFNQFNKLKSQ